MIEELPTPNAPALIPARQQLVDFYGDELLVPDLNPAEQALLLAEAVASLARQHLDLEQRHLTMADYLRPFVQQTRQQLAAHEERIEALELRLSSGATISEAHAAEIAGRSKPWRCS
jgi:hypothetical protein